LNDRIVVGFRNDKNLRYCGVISENKFPVTDVFFDENRTYAVLDTADTEMFNRYIESLSAYIINRYEVKILKRIISKKYPEIPNQVVNEIIKLKDDECERKRKKVLFDILKNYFSENESGSVEGIVNFRLYEYKVLLNELAENIVDIYYLNREYDDFIELLRYFISVQSQRAEQIYIVVNENGMYSILNEEKRDITIKALEEVVSVNDAKQLAYDDLLISVLISLAPKKIIVMHKENIKNQQIFETVEKVFEEVVYE